MPAITAPMKETPRKTSQQIDHVIDHLNARWDLQIPRLHGAVAEKAGDGLDLGKKCSSRIRALCWKSNVNMDSVIEDFEEVVQHKYSYWIWKSSQTPGTLPSLPVTKSFLRLDAVSKSQNLTLRRRQTFLEVLYGLLNEEHELANDSELYQRTSSQSVRETSRQTSFTSSRPGSKNSFTTAEEAHPTDPNTVSTRNASRMTKYATPLKKREASQASTVVGLQSDCNLYHQADLLQSSKRPKTVTKTANMQPPPSTTSVKRQQSIDNMIRRRTPPLTETTSIIQSSFDQSSQSDPLIRSFTTNATNEPDRVFSDAESGTPDSNATSFMSIDSDDVDNDRRATDLSGTQFSGGTQMEEDYNNDAGFRSFVETEIAPNFTPSKSLLDDLWTHGPFRGTICDLPEDLPYWYTFELYRLDQCMGLGVRWIWGKLLKNCQKGYPSFKEFWQAARALHRTVTASNGRLPDLPAKSSIPEWLERNESYCDSDSGSSLSFTARLDYSEHPTKRLFDFRLEPIKHDRSCRFHRHFGADRFLTIDMPYYDARSMPGALQNVPKMQDSLHHFHDSVFKWLTTNDLHIAGRTWRVFFVEPLKNRSNKKRKEDKPRQRLHLFAVDGFDFIKPAQRTSESTRHRPMSLLDFVDWHLSLKDNSQSTDMKLFARMQLGLSKTFATEVLQPYQFIDVPDMLPQDEEGNDIKDGTIMTDGCARISYQLARAVWSHFKKPGEDVPSAFQARIGGAKGLWQVDYSNLHPELGDQQLWIEIRPSQLKIKPHPSIREGTDESQRTFEVVKYSTPCDFGHLNIQLISIMNYCAVPREALRQALNADLREYVDTLKDAMNDPMKLRIWRQVNHRAATDGMEFGGGMPNSREDEVDYLLESGFEPHSCWYLTNCLKLLLKQELDSYVDKLRIRVNDSTTVFCVPDPLGLLAPGQVQLNFSSRKVNPRTKLPDDRLESSQVLVARNPAHLASDIQMVEAVYCDKLRYLKDVIIFSTKGCNPLADLLSGGDYDGDTVSVIWDPRLTEHFCNHGKPILPGKEECSIVSETKLVRDLFDVANPTAEQMGKFMYACCSLNGIRGKLGEVTIELEKLIYANEKNLGKPAAVKLAALAGYLVDSAKQGDSFGTRAWNSVRKDVRHQCGVKGDLRLAYKEGVGSMATRKIQSHQGIEECVNIVDYLKFDVAKGLRDDFLSEFYQKWGKKEARLDDQLGRLYKIELDRSRDPSDGQAKAIRDILDGLRVILKDIHSVWSWKLRGDDEFRGPDQGSKTFGNNYTQLLQDLTERVRAIEPLNTKCDIRRDFEREGGGKGSRWSLLRASYIHHHYQRGSMAWKLVGDELCTMKARAHPCGRTWEMTFVARQMLKADVKRYRRLYDDTNDVSEEFYDAEE